MSHRDTPWPAGTPCWIDVGLPDLDAGREFYTAVFGWDYTGGEEEFGGYLNATVDGRPAAGLGPLMDPAATPRWTTYFATEDAPAHLARATGAGGSVLVPPMQVGPMGTMALAVDPAGGTFGLWQAGAHTGCQVVNSHGGLVWSEGAAPEPAAARAFYTEVFGWSWSPVEGAEDYETFALEDRPLGGFGPTGEVSPVGWSVCFQIADTDAAVATVTGRGGSVPMPAVDTPFGRLAVLADPWGAAFSVMQVPVED